MTGDNNDRGEQRRQAFVKQQDAGPLLHLPKPFVIERDLKAWWKLWKQHFNNYMTASGVNKKASE